MSTLPAHKASRLLFILETSRCRTQGMLFLQLQNVQLPFMPLQATAHGQTATSALKQIEQRQEQVAKEKSYVTLQEWHRHHIYQIYKEKPCLGNSPMPLIVESDFDETNKPTKAHK